MANKSKANSKGTENNEGVKKALRAPDPNVNPEEYLIDSEVMNLVWSEPFYGTVLSMIPRKEDWECNTAYIGISKLTNEPIIGYNPDFMRELKKHHKEGILKHELLHWLFNHVTNRRVSDTKRARLWNVACDLAINSILCAMSEEALPDYCLLPGRAPKTDDPKLAELIKGFPKMESSDFYMDKLEEYLKQKQEEEGGEGEDGKGGYILDLGGALDEHDQWGDVPEEVRDILREKAADTLNRALKVAQSRGWGTVPAQMQQVLIQLNAGKVDWRSVLKNFVGRCRSVETDSTIKRLNKKMPYIFPGMKRNTVARLLWAVDQSGSMSDEMVQRGLAEAAVYSKVVEADMVNFDTEVDEASMQTIKRGKMKWERTRCGGTDFNSVAEFLSRPKNKGKWTGVIIMTDGYAPSLSRIPGVKVLWLITPDGTMDAVRSGDLVIKMDKDRTATRK